MRTLLFVNACVRPESRTLRLARQLIRQLTGKTADDTADNVPGNKPDNTDGWAVSEVNLEQDRPVPLDWDGVLQRNLHYALPFAAADTIVIAAPYWDLAFPARLKIYLEHVTVSGTTFRYSPEGIPEGLCRARALYYVTTAGGPVGDANFGYRYIERLARTFYGIPRTRCILAEGLDIAGNDPESILQQAIDALADQAPAIGEEKEDSGRSICSG